MKHNIRLVSVSRYGLLVIALGALTTLVACNNALGGSDDSTKTPTITLGVQSGAIAAGTAGSASFAVTTANVSAGTVGSITWYTTSAGTTVGSSPVGISASVTAVSNNAATVSITAGTLAAGGSYYFKLTEGSAVSAATTLTVVPKIVTIAGNGTQGYSGDGGNATSAEFYGPCGVAFDSGGNLFIADTYNNRIREISTSGIITTIAGNGTGGYSGDGGAATSAELHAPEGVAIDSYGNIFIADRGNSRIRKVIASTGIITTVAGNGTSGYSGDGGAATSAQLNYAMGVAVDSSGNIFIAEVYNNRIRKVAASTGIITTVAGDGNNGYSGDGGIATSARLAWPEGVAVDSSGNIYIADRNNCLIRKVSTSGIITTVNRPGFAGVKAFERRWR